MSNGTIYMKDWFITQLCRTKVGFQVAYRLGLARPGIDFVDVPCPTEYDGFWVMTPRSKAAIEIDFKNRNGFDPVVCPYLDPECWIGCDCLNPGCPFNQKGADQDEI